MKTKSNKQMVGKKFTVETGVGTFHFPLCLREAGKGFKIPTLVELGSLIGALSPENFPEAAERARILKEPRMVMFDAMLRKGILTGNTICRGIPKEEKLTSLAGAVAGCMAPWVRNEMNTEDGLVAFDALPENLKGSSKCRAADLGEYLKQSATVQRFAAMGKLGSLCDPPVNVGLIMALVPEKEVVGQMFFFCFKLYSGNYTVWATMPELYGRFNVYLELKNGQPYPCKDSQKDPHYLLIRPGERPAPETETVMIEELMTK